jgi:hypothetical protein
MKQSPNQDEGLTWLEAVVVLAVVLILVALALPITFDDHHTAGMRFAGTLSNARQIHQATYRMVLDGKESGDANLAWPGDLATAGDHPVTTTGEFVEHLVAHKYLDRDSLAKLFSGPKVTTYSGHGPFEGRNSVFDIYKVAETDKDTAIFLATKNFNFGGHLYQEQPFGDKGCVIVYKGGDARMITEGQAMKKEIGVMPAGTPENPGRQEGSVLGD